MENQIAELHAQGLSCYRISQILGIPSTSLHRKMTKMGLSVAHKSKVRQDPLKNHVSEIIAAYQRGESSLEIAKRFNCDGSSVTRILQAANIQSRYQYSVNEHFFTNIDNEAKAYTLGFFTADGCLTKQGVMSIRVCDLDVLEKIRTAMEFTGPIRSYPSPENFPHRQIKFDLSIKRGLIERDLVKLGCIPNKTFVTYLPILDAKLYPHYIRGLFDGDGSIRITSPKHNNWGITIAGTAPLLGPILEIIRRETGIGGGIYPAGKIFVLSIGGNQQVIKVLDWLYHDATIYMDRKYQKYLSFKGVVDVIQPVGPCPQPDG